MLLGRSCWCGSTCRVALVALFLVLEKEVLNVAVDDGVTSDLRLPGGGFGRLLNVARRDWWILALVSVVGGCCMLLVSVVQSPKYESAVSLYVTAGVDANATSAYQGAMASEQRVGSYVQLATSDAIISSALQKTGIGLSESEVRSRVRSSAEPDTVLFNISVSDSDAGRAALLANGIGAAMVEYVRDLEKPADGTQPLAKITVVSPAVVATKPFSPNFSRNVLMGLVGGLFLGLLVVLVRFRFDRYVRSSSEIESLIRKPILGAIPASTELARVGLADFALGGDAIAENYRRLRVNLSFCRADSPPRVILLTSASPSEGKSTSAVNLAAALAEAGNRVVIVGADLRKPSMPGLELLGHVGFTDCLSSELSPRSVVQTDNRSGLDVLVAGRQPPSPVELLGSSRARMCLEELRESYDYVVVDSPPVCGLADSLVLSQFVDAVLFVVRQGVCQRSVLTSAVNDIEASGAWIAGAIWNCSNGGSERYGAGYYSSSTDREFSQT